MGVKLNWLSSKVNRLQRANSKRLDDLEQQTENLALLNPAAEDQVAVTNHSQVLSLGKNAASAPIEAKVSGLTAKNEVANGDFSDGTTGWESYNSTTTVSGNTAINTAGNINSRAELHQNTDKVADGNSSYFVRATVRVTNSNCAWLHLRLATSPASTLLTVAQKATPTNGTWYTLYGKMAGAGLSGNLRFLVVHEYPGAATANGKVMEVQEVLAVDLTALGLDSLTADQVSAMLPSWFDGLQSVGATRVRSVGKNLFSRNMVLTPTNMAVEHTDNGFKLVGGSTLKALAMTFKPNTQYSFSGSCYEVADSANLRFRAVYTDGSSDSIFVPTTVETAFSFTSGAGKTIEEVAYTYTASGTTYVNNFQIEEGTSATAYEPYKENAVFVPSLPLRRVPNGTQDSIDLRTGKQVQRVQEHTLQEADFNSLYTGFADMDIVTIPRANLEGQGLSTLAANKTEWLEIGFNKVNTYTGDGSDTPNSYYVTGTGIALKISKGTYADLAAARADLVGTKVIYQLATPVETDADLTGQLYSYPNGTVYVENVLGDADYYGDGITVSGMSFSGIEKVTKVDLETGTETDITSTCALNANKNGFTSTALEAGDVCWYELRLDGPLAEQAYSYYDSRYVVTDDTDGKVYKWAIASTNGVGRLELTEV